MSTLTIEQVESEFKAWRMNKPFNSPSLVPDDLCNQVRVLLQSYPRGEVLRRCGLTLRQAKVKGLLPNDHNVESSIIESKELNPFVKMASLPAIHINQTKSVNLTLQCGDKKLFLDHPSDEQLQFIVTTFLR